jgi:hypothetical protein
MPRDCYSEFLVPNLSAVLTVRDSLVSPADGVPQPALMAGSVAGVDPWWRGSCNLSSCCISGSAFIFTCYLTRLVFLFQFLLLLPLFTGQLQIALAVWLCVSILLFFDQVRLLIVQIDTPCKIVGQSETDSYNE